MTKTKKKSKKKPAKRSARTAHGGKSGKWVFDAKSGKLVKISDRIPKVASKTGGSPGGGMPCGQGACANCPAKHSH